MNSVRLMHYDPRWKQEFQQSRSGILQSCAGSVRRIEHIGSTAIEGLIARPVIDMIAEIDSETEPNESINHAVAMIEGLNYRLVESDSWAEEAVTLVKPRHGDSTHRLLLVQKENQIWNRAIGIRNKLAADRDLALRFEETKVARWKQNDGDPQRYADDKAIFFMHLIDQIES